MDYADSDKKIIWAAATPGMGHHFFFALMNVYGDMDEAFTKFDGREKELSMIPTAVRQELLRRKDLSLVDQMLGKWRGIDVIPFTSPVYPPLLKEVYDFPIVLYVRGKLPEEPCVSIVGTRKCTDYGKEVAKELGQRIAGAGKAVVSGGARGIDSCAHEGAVFVGGKTVAVLGCGVDVCYPAENRELFLNMISLGGGLISEYPPGTPPLSQHFPARNRIISGLSKELVVVESGKKSGAHITVRYALEQGREVYAVPGNITSPASEGTNRLIFDGARPLVSLDQWGDGEQAKTPLPKPVQLPREDQMIYDAIGKKGKATLDQLQESTGLAVSIISSHLTMMEIKGIIKKLPGNYFTL